MPSIRIPTPLRVYADGNREINVQGQTVGQVLDNLVSQHPNLQTHLFTDSGDLRAFVNLFLREDNVNDLQGLETELQNDDRLMLIPSIAGG